MEPVIGVAGIALGALLTWLASLYGARQEAEREHGRWLRDQRYLAIGAFSDALATFVSTIEAEGGHREQVLHPTEVDGRELVLAQRRQALMLAYLRLITTGPPRLADIAGEIVEDTYPVKTSKAERDLVYEPDVKLQLMRFLDEASDHVQGRRHSETLETTPHGATS